MPAEVDPVVVKKFRDALHRMVGSAVKGIGVEKCNTPQVYEILGSAVDKMAMMFEDVL